MNCSELSSKISGYVDGELSSEELTIVEEHLEGCSDCQSALESEEGMKSIFHQAYSRSKAPVKLRANIRKALAKEDRFAGALSLIFMQPKSIAAVVLGVIAICAISIQGYRMLHSPSVMNVMHIQDMHAKIECIGCHYAETSLASKSYCDEYGHTYAIMTDAHDIFSLIPNEQSEEFSSYGLHAEISITGWMYYQANFIEIENYQVVKADVASLDVSKN